MRVSTSQIYDIANIGMRDAQSAINKTSEQLSTGKRVLSPADDPVAAAQILQLNQQLSRTEQFTKNIDVAENRLNLEESSLESITDLIQNSQELAISAGNTGAMTQSEFKIIASEVDTRIKELVGLQNTKDATGQYIFAGYQSEQAPYELQGGEYVYQGDDGSLSMQVSESVTIQATDPGRKVFDQIETGNNRTKVYDPDGNVSSLTVENQETFNQLDPANLSVTYNAGQLEITNVDGSANEQISSPIAYTPGDTVNIYGMELTMPATTANGDSFTLHVAEEKNSLLNTLVDFRDALRSVDNTPESKEQLREVVDTTLGTLDNGVTRLGEVQSEVGARLNTLESTRELNSDSKLYTEEVLSDLQNLDYAEASTRLKMQELVLRAAQQSFSQVSQLTLFNYL